MDPHPSKKPYITPQLFRIELNPEQAILSACSLMTMTAANGGSGSCRTQGGGCKRHSLSNGDAGPRLS
jgi:hypothetical protein